MVRGPRGIEIAEILVAPERFSGTDDGDVLRAATPADDAETSRLRRPQPGVTRRRILTGKRTWPTARVRRYRSHTRWHRDSHALPWDACDATALLDELASRFGLAVRLLDLSRSPTANDPPATGCGKPGCGSESGGGSSVNRRLLNWLMLPRGREVVRRTDRVFCRSATENGRRRARPHAAELSRPYNPLRVEPHLRARGALIRHKLVARKRLLLFPIRDTVVEGALGLNGPKDLWWRPLWGALSSDDAMVSHLSAIRQLAETPHLSLLRVADIVIWLRNR